MPDPARRRRERGRRPGLIGKASERGNAPGFPVLRTGFPQAAALPESGTAAISARHTDSHYIFPEHYPMAETTDDRLRLLIERVERLEEEKKGISDDIRDVYNEGKAVGYDVKIMRQIVRIRKMKPDDRREMDMLLDTYKTALGND
jgi:uncharacterized protein (UPF0335 family)